MQFDWVTFALEIVNFLVLVWLLKRFLYQPVLQAIARRKENIERTLADARAQQAGAQALEQKLNGRLADWERERNEMRARAEADLEAERERRMRALQDALDKEAARRGALEERGALEARERVENEALAQGARFAARLLERLASPELEARLIALALEDLARLTEAQLQTLRAACRGDRQAAVTASAYELSAAGRNAIAQGLERATGTRLTAQFVRDPGLMAGLRIDIGPWSLNANLRDELAGFVETTRHDG